MVRPDRPIFAARNNRVAVRTERSRRERAVVPLESDDVRPVLRVPKATSIRSRDHPAPVRAELRIVNRGVVLQASDLALRLRRPK